MSVPAYIPFKVDSFEMLLSMFDTDLQKFDDFLCFIGLIVFGKFALTTLWELLWGIRSMIWSRLFKKNFSKRYGGDWAVVTGCTDGIGRAYANEMAKDGLNVLLLSRSAEKLAAVSREIESTYHVKTEVVQADFSSADIYEGIAAKLSGKSIAVLVNNVGVMTDHPKYCHEYTDADVKGHVNVNMLAATQLLRAVLPGMRERRRGAVVNVASIAANTPIPMLGIYAASKAYVKWLSQSTALEYPYLDIQTVTPSYVRTKMVGFSFLIAANPLVPSAAAYATSAVSTLGYAATTTGYWSHGLQAWACDLVPQWLYMRLMMAMHWLLRRTPSTPGHRD